MGDHTTTVHADIECHPQRSRPVKRKVYMWDKANIDQLKIGISNQVEDFVNNNSITTPINELWKKFKSMIDLAQEKYVPNRMTSQRFNQPWVNKDCKRMFRKKKRVYNRAKLSNLPSDWDKFRETAAQTRKACKSAYNTFVRESVCPSIKQNPKRFFSFIKGKKCDSIGVSPLRDQGSTYINNADKAHILNNQFSSVFSHDDGSTPSMRSNQAEAMPPITIDIAGVRKLMKELKPFKASGPDAVHARFLKETCNELAKGMTLLFQASLHQSQIPDAWRDALVTPIYKQGKKDRGKAENYRPVSLTSVSCKILEHIIHSNVMDHLNSHNILTDVQHGFRKKRSCETQLVITINDLAKCLNEGQQMDSTLLDFSKAFDKVNHRKLQVESLRCQRANTQVD